MINDLATAAAAQRARLERESRKAAAAAEMVEFKAKERDLIGDLPEPFFNLVSSLAWEEGHYAGFREVLVHIEDIGDRVRIALREYEGK